MSDAAFNEASTAAGREAHRVPRPGAVGAPSSTYDTMSDSRGRSSRMMPRAGLAWAIIFTALCMLVGCGAINPGRWRGIETAPRDEAYYLLKDVFLTSGSAAFPRESFDHDVHHTVNLMFTLANEPNTYVAKSVWQDPDGMEFRTIRTTHDSQQEGKEGAERNKKGTMRVHTVETRELYAHKPGIWKVSLYIDGTLARRLSFFVR